MLHAPLLQVHVTCNFTTVYALCWNTSSRSTWAWMSSSLYHSTSLSVLQVVSIKKLFVEEENIGLILLHPWPSRHLPLAYGWPHDSGSQILVLSGWSPTCVQFPDLALCYHVLPQKCPFSSFVQVEQSYWLNIEHAMLLFKHSDLLQNYHMLSK